ncbi:MAG TPA: D-sedoheptulose 7-phosphate isomerase [Candidatus Omnitrophota bacterium]|jgi:D-sedoheptulose 7-phosphate isomerase|nr:MAG: Phosphoheptose isomerase [Candidatus Omnitrophica bacterium ADurb.Bin314]HOE69023.1 D-sedoheptulose 7-phosphate isomerase [Candidatus Omnitrophota bacterium]HPW65187.1 D-sedoheptulose 7-phosphate isomerase [Candidatus Omnitrophota bacterium]HQB93843.1 D-sedoheptulose 7-phosphate isomerase [Candidatus Omnitrophota bacterium]
MRNYFDAVLAGHADAFQKTFVPEQLAVIDQIVRAIIDMLKGGHKLLLCGNGGSGTDALHIAAEFVGRFEKERISLPAIALTADTASITAIGNDYGYDRVFERQVEGLGQKGDVLFALSTSGKSPNVLKAIEKAKRKGILTVGFTGKDGGAMKDAVDLLFLVRSNKTAHIQEMHMVALHGICETVEGILFG